MKSEDLYNFSGKEWRLIHGESHYYVSEDGDVYNQKLDNILSKQLGKNGYESVNLRGKTKYLHNLVCTAFHGIRPKGKVIDHIDRCKTNNYYKNLRWSTPRENCINRKVQKPMSKNFKFNEWRVIIDRYLTGFYSQHEICVWANKKFNRNSSTMIYNKIVNGFTYKEWYSTLEDWEITIIQSTIEQYKTYYR